MIAPRLLTLSSLVLLASCVVSEGRVVDDIWAGRNRRADAKRRQAYVQAHPGLEEESQEAILEGDVRIGMTREEVRASWGIPDRSGRVVLEGSSVRLWEYGTVGLVFEEGRLGSFRDLSGW